MNDAFGNVPEPGCVRFERLLPGPIERVWAHLTDPALRARWLAGGTVDLRSGGSVRLDFRNADLSPGDDRAPARYCDYENSGTMHGRITRLDPPRLLAYTWTESDDEAHADDSEVTFALEPAGDRVRLTLTHRKLRTGEMTSVASGWHTHLGILDDVLSGRRPRPFWRTHTQLEAQYEARLAPA